MARALGKRSEADRWLEEADDIRGKILRRLYVKEDACFYDLDAKDRFVRIRSDVLSRVLGEHVVDRRLFQTIYERQIHNPRAFWSPFPLPSIALNDPAFVRPITANSWGGPSQALTALRAPRWMDYYNRPADLAHLMQQWTGAILTAGAFLQQMDPMDGTFTRDTGDYSPAALVFLDFTWRLAGIRQEDDGLEWNVRPPAVDVTSSFRFRISPTQIAEIRYAGGGATLLLNGRQLCAVNGVVRLFSDVDGKLHLATGIAPKAVRVTITYPSGRKLDVSVQPNASKALSYIQGSGIRAPFK